MEAYRPFNNPPIDVTFRSRGKLSAKNCFCRLDKLVFGHYESFFFTYIWIVPIITVRKAPIKFVRNFRKVIKYPLNRLDFS